MTELSGEQGGGPEKQAQPASLVQPQKHVFFADALQAFPLPTGGPQLLWQFSLPLYPLPPSFHVHMTSPSEQGGMQTIVTTGFSPSRMWEKT